MQKILEDLRSIYNNNKNKLNQSDIKFIKECLESSNLKLVLTMLYIKLVRSNCIDGYNIHKELYSIICSKDKNIDYKTKLDCLKISLSLSDNEFKGLDDYSMFHINDLLVTLTNYPLFAKSLATYVNSDKFCSKLLSSRIYTNKIINVILEYATQNKIDLSIIKNFSEQKLYDIFYSKMKDIKISYNMILFVDKWIQSSKSIPEDKRYKLALLRQQNQEAHNEIIHDKKELGYFLPNYRLSDNQMKLFTLYYYFIEHDNYIAYNYNRSKTLNNFLSNPELNISIHSPPYQYGPLNKSISTKNFEKIAKYILNGNDPKYYISKHGIEIQIKDNNKAIRYKLIELVYNINLEHIIASKQDCDKYEKFIYGISLFKPVFLLPLDKLKNQYPSLNVAEITAINLYTSSLYSSINRTINYDPIDLDFINKVFIDPKVFSQLLIHIYMYGSSIRKIPNTKTTKDKYRCIYLPTNCDPKDFTRTLQSTSDYVLTDFGNKLIIYPSKTNEFKDISKLSSKNGEDESLISSGWFCNRTKIKLPMDTKQKVHIYVSYYLPNNIRKLENSLPLKSKIQNDHLGHYTTKSTLLEDKLSNFTLTILNYDSVKKALNYAYNNYLSKPYTGENLYYYNSVVEPKDFGLSNNEFKTVQRANHGLLHIIAKICMIMPVIEHLLNDGNQKIKEDLINNYIDNNNLNGKKIIELALATIFTTAGRDNEYSIVDNKDKYLIYKKKSSLAFYNYFKDKKVFDYKSLDDFTKIIQDMGNPDNNNIHNIILSACHSLSLARVLDFTDYQKHILSFFKKIYEDNQLATNFFQLERTMKFILIGLGFDHISNDVTFDKDYSTFFLCSHDVDLAISRVKKILGGDFDFSKERKKHEQLSLLFNFKNSPKKKPGINVHTSKKRKIKNMPSKNKKKKIFN